MARLLIMFDPGNLVVGHSEADRHFMAKNGVRHASIDIADDLATMDIYQTARKLADMLLEQIAKDQS